MDIGEIVTIRILKSFEVSKIEASGETMSNCVGCIGEDDIELCSKLPKCDGFIFKEIKE